MNNKLKKLLIGLLTFAVIIGILPASANKVKADTSAEEAAEEVIIKELDDIVLAAYDMEGFDTKASLDAVVSPSTADQQITWTSSDLTVAVVGNDGLVTAVRPGTAVITATAVNGVSAAVNVTVVSSPKWFSLNKKKATLKKGKTLQITPVLPAFTVCPKYTYTSSNKKVATVSNTGMIKAKKKGTAVITVTCYNNPSLSAIIKIKVK